MTSLQVLDLAASPAESLDARELTFDEIELISGGLPLKGCTFYRTFVYQPPRGDGDDDCAD
jgi:hypothetical protein